MNRRNFLAVGLGSIGGLAFGPDFWRKAYAAPATIGSGPYGPLLEPDPNGIQLPGGFASRILAHSLGPVASTSFVWHRAPDGAATFPGPRGQWTYVCNSEVPGGKGGVSAVRFSANGSIDAAYTILSGTSMNCAGGPTPWGTWMSCEETSEGRVWECDPSGRRGAVVRPAMGTFMHEAVAVDPHRRRLYLTEDESDGRFYRFTPARYPDCASGALEVAAVEEDGSVSWLSVPDPKGRERPTREQVGASTAFNGGEGIWYDSGNVYFTTKGDNRVWAYSTRRQRLDVLYDAVALGNDAPLVGVDNIVVASSSGDLYVAEDGGNMEIVIITPDREVAPFLRVLDHAGSELTGPVFNPKGDRFYFSSQRGPGKDGPGITYEVTGPFRGRAGGVPIRQIGTGAAAALVAAAAAWRLRARSRRNDDDEPVSDSHPEETTGS